MKTENFTISVLFLIFYILFACENDVIETYMLKDPIINFKFDGNILEENNKVDAIGYKIDFEEDLSKKRKSIKFNGIDSYVELKDSEIFEMSNTSFSISLWLKIYDNEPTYRTFFIISNKNVIPRLELMKCRSNYTCEGKIFAELRQTKNDDQKNIVFSRLNGSQLEKDKWIHMAVVINRESNLFQLYLDGELQGEEILINYDLKGTPDLPTKVRFGETTWSNNVFNRQRHNGNISDFRLYNFPLTKDDINNIFNKF